MLDGFTMKTLFTVVLALSVFLLGRAESDVRAVLIHEIVQIQGVDEMLRDAKKAARAQAEAVVGQMFDQVRSGMPLLPKEKFDAIQTAADKLMHTIDESWTTENAIQVWEAEYVTDFTEGELRAVLDACKTPIGKKQIAAGKRAGSALQKYMLASGKPKMDAAVKEYISDVQKIVTDGTP